MATIKDKNIQICVCGKNEKTVVLTAKYRVIRWLGLAGTGLIILSFATGNFPMKEFLGIKGLVASGAALYIVLSIIFRLVQSKKDGHKTLCALRYASLKV